MPRQITQEAQAAFRAGISYYKSNTEVRVFGNENDVKMYLFGNEIAKRIGKHTYITNAGWNTPTTRERLHNIIPGVIVCQRKGQLQLNGEAWDGEWVEVK